MGGLDNTGKTRNDQQREASAMRTYGLCIERSCKRLRLSQKFSFLTDPMVGVGLRGMELARRCYEKIHPEKPHPVAGDPHCDAVRRRSDSWYQWRSDQPNEL